MVDLRRILLSDSFWKFRFGLKQTDQFEDPGITEKWFDTGIPEPDVFELTYSLFVMPFPSFNDAFTDVAEPRVVYLEP